MCRVGSKNHVKCFKLQLLFFMAEICVVKIKTNTTNYYLTIFLVFPGVYLNYYYKLRVYLCIGRIIVMVIEKKIFLIIFIRPYNERYVE